MAKKKVASKPKKDKKVVKEEVKPERANGIVETTSGFVVSSNGTLEYFEGGDELSCFNEACKRYKILMIS